MEEVADLLESHGDAVPERLGALVVGHEGADQVLDHVAAVHIHLAVEVLAEEQRASLEKRGKKVLPWDDGEKADFVSPSGSPCR